VARVAAGAVAKKLLAVELGARVVGYVRQIGDVVAEIGDPAAVTPEAVELLPDGTPNLVRCPDPARAAEMVALIERVRKEQDSIGGVAEIVASGVPAGLGEPVFDKLRADLGKALFSLPAVLGVETGIGFACATLRGSENNDAFFGERTASGAAWAHAQQPPRRDAGGISSGMPIVLRAAVKPTSSLPRDRRRDPHRRAHHHRTGGRHDPASCPLRAHGRGDGGAGPRGPLAPASGLGPVHASENAKARRDRRSVRGARAPAGAGAHSCYGASP
jgi:chorismate synthase